MNLKLEKYQTTRSSVLEDLFFEDEFVRGDILGCLSEFPECAMMVRSDIGILAIGVYTGISEKTSFTMYVHPDHRNQGVGSFLLTSLEKDMAEKGVKEIVCDYEVNDSMWGFLNKRGYEKWFRSNHMIFNGNIQTPAAPFISAYVDSDYPDVQKILSESFHEMRLHVGLTSSITAPSEEERSSFLKKADDIFILRDHCEIVAVAMVEGNEIDKIAVAVDEQGKGYGKVLLGYTADTLLHRGFNEITLWVVEGNPAKILYKHFGFKVHRLHEFVQKKL